jgi:signal transduction histidine kinase
MIEPSLPENEQERLEALRNLQILDTLPEESYDRITRLAFKFFNVPIALLSLVDEKRQWFKSKQGLDADETGRDISFCGHAINADEPFIINNAIEDERFHDNPLVTGGPKIRFYAGRPLKTLNGSLVGTLCIISPEPREFTDPDIDALDDLANMVEKELHLIELSQQIIKKQAALEIALEKAEDANIEKSRFLANMSHELRTPMHAILSFSEIGGRKINDEKVSKYFSNINVSATRLMGLINDLLDISKLEAGKMEVNFLENDIAEIWRHSLETVTPLAENKSMNLIYKGEEKLFALFDKKLITQVMINLLSNAIKYSADNTSVLIMADIRKVMHKGKSVTCIHCSVKDEGLGIPAAELDTIFDRFVESSHTKKGSGGTGLGLSICREIIQLHQGMVWVESPWQEGKSGSAFYFQIPQNPHQIVNA